jgi:hypothetical protein
VEEF